MTTRVLSAEALERALQVRDLSDPDQGPHAMQELVRQAISALSEPWGCALRLHRAQPVVSVQENYDALHYPAEGAARDARYSRYVSADSLLRTHTSAMIPPLLRALAAAPLQDVLLACPGLVWRRDSIDRLHTGVPHQLDLWRIAARPLGEEALREIIHRLVTALLPGREYRCPPTMHPYTLAGREILVLDQGGWVEIGECGLALPALLEEAGLSPGRYSGLAMGLGLDRLLMLVKGIGDIRLLRSDDPRVAGQLLDLAPYRPVSRLPAIRRDLSVAVPEGTDGELLGDRVREALGTRAESLESVEVLSETAYAVLPTAARERLGMRRGQKNVLLRLVIRDPVRTLTDGEANLLRDEVYAAVHEGSAWQWAARPATP